MFHVRIKIRDLFLTILFLEICTIQNLYYIGDCIVVIGSAVIV